jgi:photosynthetic reaction center H subunit
MDDVKIVGNLDVTELVFLAFVFFFIWLVVYLQRESRREGYPLEDEMTGRVDTPGGVLSMASPKTFLMPHGRPAMTVPDGKRDKVDQPGNRTFRAGGAPYYPTGNPLIDGIGPAAWAERSHHTDLTAEGEDRIVPIGMAPHIDVSRRDPDPRGMTVIAADGAVAGTISDIWVDRSEHVIRYLEVDLGHRKVLAPMGVCKVHKPTPGFLGLIIDRIVFKKSIVAAVQQPVIVEIDAINAADFANVPALAKAGQITLYEEERVMAYYGGGYLYANRKRQEPLI